MKDYLLQVVEAVPTSLQLGDGRIRSGFKGRVDEKADEDRDLGFLWVERSEGQGLFVMAFERDEHGRTIREQLKATIAAPAVR